MGTDLSSEQLPKVYPILSYRCRLQWPPLSLLKTRMLLHVTIQHQEQIQHTKLPSEK